MKYLRFLSLSTSAFLLSFSAQSAFADDMSSSCSFTGGVVKLASDQAEQLFSGWAEQGHIVLACNGDKLQSFEIVAHREKTNGSVQLVNDEGKELDYLIHINGVEVNSATPVNVLEASEGSTETKATLSLSVIAPDLNLDAQNVENYSNFVTLEAFVI